MKLLTAPTANPKVAKNDKKGVLTAPLHLAPADLSGHNVCPMASAGCKAACLHTAGNPLYMAGKQRARIARTHLYFSDRASFMLQLHREIEAHMRKAKRMRMKPGIRLNATSDIPWHRVAYVGPDGRKWANVMAAFPRVAFYDYTKRTPRKGDIIPPNYHLTFSLAEDNDKAAQDALLRGVNVAVVFDTKRGQPLPTHFMGQPVLDGDDHDFRPADGRYAVGVIVGLRAKGQAIGDRSGFVRHAASAHLT